jgi:hypothetical protein
VEKEGRAASEREEEWQQVHPTERDRILGSEDKHGYLESRRQREQVPAPTTEDDSKSRTQSRQQQELRAATRKTLTSTNTNRQQRNCRAKRA